MVTERKALEDGLLIWTEAELDPSMVESCELSEVRGKEAFCLIPSGEPNCCKTAPADACAAAVESSAWSTDTDRAGKLSAISAHHLMDGLIIVLALFD